MKFDNHTFDMLAASLKAGQYNLLLGSGISRDSRNRKGFLPSGETLRQELCQLKGAHKSSSLQRVYATLTSTEIQEHIVDRFIDCTPGNSVVKLGKFLWHRIFTFNVDDALQNAYLENSNLQTSVTIHFRDAYSEVPNLTQVPVIHLHGWVQKADRGFVFSRDEYVRQTTAINPWMVLLTQFLPVEPFIILGASLDEMDLDYYLAHRTEITAREDRGPSILVEPHPDAVTENDCKRFNLELYQGTAEQFLDELLEYVPYRPTPLELIPHETKNLLPPHVSDVEKLAFAADFELIPGIVNANSSVSRFFYGKIPTWEDLASNKDVGRPISATIAQKAINVLANPSSGPRIFLIEDRTGSGKSTIIRRAVFEMAKQGITALNCLATSGIEPIQTASSIDQIVGPVVVMIDDLADQVIAVNELIGCLTKKNIVFVCAERIYRRKYIEQAMSGVPYEKFGGLKLREIDTDRLIERYRGFGLLGAPDLANRRRKSEFLVSIGNDPVAIACCRILNDLRPLNGIVDSLINETPEQELRRYLIAALAHHCFRSGVRYSVLRFATGGSDWRQQFIGVHQMPLILSDHGRGDFVLPENSTLATSILQRIADNDKDVLLSAFVDLANAIAPRVNPEQIRKRAPEARLAARLFDYDQVVAPFLGKHSFSFFEQTKQSWDWNSRYWTQIALMYLAVYLNDPESHEGREALTQAGYHARHARSIEEHPVVLTTLGQVLLAQMSDESVPLKIIFDEAYELLSLSIDIERRWIRPSVHPFVSLFRGAREYKKMGGTFTGKQISSLRDLEYVAREKFGRDAAIQEAILLLRQIFP